METTSRVTGQSPQGAPEGAKATAEGVPAARRTVDGFLRAPFPWYGLDEAFTGPRWLMQVALAADGTVQHGSIGHGDEPSRVAVSVACAGAAAVAVGAGATSTWKISWW
ncbi:hypothetical protein ABZ726_38385, partial [Streptomyces hundungensis]